MISTIEISLIAVLAIINYQGVAAVTRERVVGEIVPMRAEHSATRDVNRDAPKAIDLDFDTSSITAEKDGSAWFKLTFDKVSCIKKVIRYRRDRVTDLSWTCTQSADGRCEQCDGTSISCSKYTLSISTTEDAASSGASLPSNSDCKYGDTIELTSASIFVLYELAVIAKEVVQCTLPAVSENSQYEVEGVAQGDGTNVAVGTSFTLVCDEGYTFKNSKTSVQTCTEDLATSDISNECTRQEEHEKYSAGTKAWSGHVFVVISTLLSFYIA